MKTSIPRLRSVRFKDGRAPLRVIRPAPGNTCQRDQFVRTSESIATTRPYLSGYAIVAWDDDGSTSVDMGTNGLPVPQMMVPEYIKTCLLDWIATSDSTRSEKQ